MGKSSKSLKKSQLSAVNGEKHAPEQQISAPANEKSPGLTFIGKIGIFFGFPFLVGLMGLYLGYLASLKDPARKMDIDQDFIMPFLLAIAMAVVIGIQTNGYSTREIKPLIKWPKVKRVKKYIRKDEDGNTESSESKKDN